MRWYYWLIVAILLFLSMFYSCADMVFSIVDKEKLQKDIEKGNKRAKVAYAIANDYEFSISIILFGNNVVNIFASSIVTIIGLSLNPDIGPSIATIAFTIILIIFAEFLPKAIGKRFAYSFALFLAYPVLFFKYLFFIFVWPISKLFILFGLPFKKRSKEEEKIDEEVLNEMVDTIEEEGILEENEADLVRGAIDLSDIQAYEIMTPRVDVFAIDINDDIEELIKDGEIFIHSRIPVYEDTIDNIIGILPIKALGKAILKEEKIDILKLCYKPLVIPRNHQVLDLLNEFKTLKVHIAVIIDEYGGTEGIITMEDILEEVVGDIFDEMDEVEEEIIDKGNNIYIIDGSMNIDDFFEFIEFNDEFETDYSTVSGLALEILDRFPRVGDTFNFANYSCYVLEADEFTVIKLEIKKIDEQKDE